MKLFKNPLTTWTKYFFKNLHLEWKYRNKNLMIGSGAVIKNSDFGRFVTITDDVTVSSSYIGDCSYINVRSKVSMATIGKFCSVAPDVKIGLGGTHPHSNFVSTHPAFYAQKKQIQIYFADKNYFNEYAETIIGNDVWIGTNALILDGSKIGNGAIVAAGSVVTQDVPPYAIVGGVPAKIIKYRFAEEQIKILLESEWWDKDLNWLREHFHAFHDFEKFRELIKK